MLIQEGKGTILSGSDPAAQQTALPGQPAGMELKLPVKMTIGEKEVADAIQELKKYKAGKESLEKRIVENEQWYKLRHWEVIRSKYSQGDNASKNRPEPSSAWLFNTLANKHADAMDNYPDPNILPREPGDQQDALSLTSIIPVILERNEFEETYNDGWWYKLKMGTAPYGSFWDPTLENGLGDISIKNLDILNLFWEPGIKDIQKSRKFFIVDLVDNDILESEHPELKGKLSGDTIDITEYVYDDTVDTTNKSVVVDCYYKKKVGSKTILHIMKFVGKNLIFASENELAYQNNGWYEHGKYPVVFDVLFPEEGTPYGFGFIDICKDPQTYIDKINQIIMENALRAGKKRYWVSENSDFNLDEFADWSKEFIKVTGSISEDKIREIDTKQLDGSIMNFLTYKVEELKETSGNRDVNQGSAGGGVTAAAAIAALQEAGNKGSRDMIKGSYRAYAKLLYMDIELVRQFYTIQRTFRIEGKDAAMKFITYSNANLVPQQTEPAAPGMDPGVRMPIFDIKVKPQRSNPFSRMAQNELAKEFYGLGMFNPQQADQALIAMEMMDFEGKETIVEKISKNQQLLAMITQFMQLLGIKQGVGTGQNPPAPGASAGASTNKQSSGGMDGAAEASTTSYGERLAERAKVKAE